MTHRRYGRGQDDLFHAITRHRSGVVHPASVLDVGAGTGSWHSAIRAALGPSIAYVGLDQSPAMVAGRHL